MSSSPYETHHWDSSSQRKIEKMLQNTNHWLVGFGPPRPEKYGISPLGWWLAIPNILMGKCQIHGNQTTNQNQL